MKIPEVQIKRPTRGGYRIRKRLKTSQALALEALWENFGGCKTLSELTGFNSQFFVNWKLKGAVPFRYIPTLSKVLSVSPWLLNYAALYNLLGDKEAPDWYNLVEPRNNVGLARFSEKQLTRILNGKPPVE